MDKKTIRPDKGFKYQVPYTILVPKDVDNLLIAGRCVSVDHEALGSLRVMPQCGVLGEAAGTSAVLSIQENVSPKKININRLQEILRNQGCILNEDDIAKANKI